MVACGGSSKGATAPATTPAAATGSPASTTGNTGASEWYSSLVITVPSTGVVGTPITATVTPLAGTTFVWAVTGGTIQGANNGQSVTFTPTAVGTLSLSCTATQGSQSSTGVLPIKITGAPPAAPVITVPAKVNAGTGGLSASATVPAGDSCSWVISGPGSAVSGATSPVFLFNAGVAGTIDLTCTISNAYGSTSSTSTVQVVGLPPSAVQITAPASATANATGLCASVPVQSGCSYAWSASDGTLVSGASTPTVTFSAGAVGTLGLTCMVSNTYGSTSAQGSVNVLPDAPVTPVITAPSQTHTGSVALVASVPSQANCTYAWTVTGGTLTSGQGTRSIVFSAGAAGTLKLNCTVTNSVQVSASGQASVAVIAYQPDGFYGSGLTVDELANTPIGKVYGFQLSYRIMCNHTGSLADVRPYFIWSATEAGYAAGTGGTIQVQIQTDDGTANHNPSGTALASVVYPNPVTNPAGNYPKLVFNGQAQLTAGNLYHVVFTNIDADPDDNWVSVDSGYIDYCNNPAQPTVSNTNLATLWRVGSTGSWSMRESSATESFLPIIELDYADGASQGQGYMEFWIGAPETISGSKMVRETFTVSGSTRLVSTAAVHLNYVSGSSPLTISLEDVNGNILGSGTVAQVPVTPGLCGGSWAQVTFASPLTLTAGQTYNLVLSAPADTVYTAFPMRKGLDKGFSTATVFNDGYAEFNGGSGWNGWTQWGTPDLTDSDLQFYFQVVD
jgi:hypothetical protein